MEVRAFGEFAIFATRRETGSSQRRRAVSQTTDSQTLSMDCEAPLEANQSDRDDQVFAWNQLVNGLAFMYLD
jgi:hypothetical protein